VGVAPATSPHGGVVPGARSVLVEVVLLRASPRLAYRVLVGHPSAAETPDAAALRVAGLPAHAWRRPDLVVHSTSWRYDTAGRVVLTYVVLPDPDVAGPATELASPRIARGVASGRPTPARVGVDEVVAHAVRHLAFLLPTDPQVRRAVGPAAEWAAALREWDPAPAGAAPATR